MTKRDAVENPARAGLHQFGQMLKAMCRPSYRKLDGPNYWYEYADRPQPPRTVALWRLKAAFAAMATVTRKDGERVCYDDSRAAVLKLIRAVEQRAP